MVEPRTWFKNIRSLKSGHYIIIKENKISYEKNWNDLKNLWIQADKNQKKKLLIKILIKKFTKN